MERPVQDLSSFALPKNFRGRPAWFVQLWWIVQATLFRMSPQVLYGWRRFLLRLFGAKIGRGVIIRPTAEITYPWKLTLGDHCWIGDHATLYTLGEISIGNNAVVSQHCYLAAATHDYTQPTFDMLAKPIIVEPEAWLATRVFVAPGVTVGRGAVVGACSVVLKDVPAMMICAGYPAQALRARVPNSEPAALAEALERL
ncbi:MAG TPA: putative colanic acid biosynthesis acetyltransferase [Acidobacteriaceae bacterium]|jgi:putative colanic acid biosynthesis acetyltransferase WcaF|nr:putative colanic acid biosynthesis acetyltransferase [Acidobacteriaceae bacterium]